MKDESQTNYKRKIQNSAVGQQNSPNNFVDRFVDLLTQHRSTSNEFIKMKNPENQ